MKTKLAKPISSTFVHFCFTLPSSFLYQYQILLTQLPNFSPCLHSTPSRSTYTYTHSYWIGEEIANAIVSLKLHLGRVASQPTDKCWRHAAAFPSVATLICANNSFPWSLQELHLESIAHLWTCWSVAAKFYKQRWGWHNHIFLETKLL